MDAGVAYPRLIPCLDVTAGAVVKGVEFQQLRAVGDPVDLALAYSDGGADELVLLDITASRLGDPTCLDVVVRVADVLTIPFTVGGGVRTRDDAARIIDAGADRVSVNSAAIARPELISEIAALFGSQAVVVAIDTDDGRVFSHGGTERTALVTIAWAARVAALGAGEILLTSIRHDGTRNGYDLETTSEVRQSVSIPVIASGGAGSAAHVADALTVTDAALVASIVHDDPVRFTQLRRDVEKAGVHLRPLAEVSA